MRQQRLIGLATALAVSVAFASSASAQALGIPVYNSGVPRGIGLYGDVAFPNADYGKGTGLAATGRVGLGFVGVSATVATYNPKGPTGSTSSVAATANLRVFGGPLMPLSVTLQGGAGYWKQDTGVPGSEVKNWHFPVGLGIALSIPNPALAIKPWIAPRLDVVRSSVGSIHNTETNFGISGGVELNLLSGLGLHASYDWVKNGSVKPSVFAVGAHYAIRVPGL